MTRKTVNRFEHKGFITPPIPPPDDFVYFCVPVPNESQHIENFLGALQTLTLWTNYQRTADKRGKQIADIWRDIFLDLTYSTDSCVEVDNLGNCRTYDAAEERVTFLPAIDAPELPLGFGRNPWVEITGPNPLVGLKTGDVITDLARMPLLPTVWDRLDNLLSVLGLGYPSISITGLVGRGTVRVYLLSVLLGGRALIVRDNDLLSASFLDTNLDTVSLPPETYAENLVEYKFETSGEHRLDIVFIPNVSVDIEFLGFGGGFRRVEICGFEENPMPVDDECCDDLVLGQRKTNLLLSKIISMMQSGMTATISFGDGDGGGGGGDSDDGGFVLPDLSIDCTPKDFDGNEDDTGTVAENRESALCITVSRYIVSVLFNLAVESNAGTTIKNNLKSLITPLALPNEFTSGLTAPGVPTSPGGLAYLDIIALSHLATDMSTLVDDLICDMVASLTGRQNTFANFRTCIADAEEPADEASQYRWLMQRYIKWSNEIRGNFIIFSQQLEATFLEVEEGLTYECPCEGVAPEEPVIVAAYEIDGTPLSESAALVITNLGGGNYRFEQNTATGAGRYAVMFKDQFNRCLHMGAPTAGQGSLAAFSYFYIDCDDVYHDGTGGGRPDAKISGEDYNSPADVGWLITLV